MHGAGRRRAKCRPQIFGLEEYILKPAVSLEGTFDLGAELKTRAELVGRGARIANIETLPLLSLSREASRERGSPGSRRQAERGNRCTLEGLWVWEVGKPE